MKECKKTEKKLMSLIHNVLNSKEKKEIQKHFNECTICKEKYEKLQKAKAILESPTALKSPDHFNYVLEEAKKRKNSMASRVQFYKFLLLLNILKKTKLPVRIAAGLVSILLVISLLFLLPLNHNKLYIMQASGNIEINNQSFFNNPRIKHNLKDVIDIQNKNGTCVFQLATGKLIVLKKNTHIKILQKEHININLLEGTLIGKVLKNKKEKKIIITSANVQFEIIGTVFSVKKTGEDIECEVEKGIIKATVHNKNYYIKQGEKTSITGKKVLFVKEVPKKRLLEKINEETFTQDFKHMRKVLIKSSPENKVYWKNIKLGNTPLFLWGKTDKVNNLFITRNGYISRELNLTGKKSYKFEITLKKKKQPEIIWSKRLRNTVFVKPYYTEQFIILTDDRGTTYKIDLSSGDVIWSFNPGMRMSSKIAYFKRRIYISYNDDFLYAIDFETGKAIWRAQTGTLVYSAPQYYKGRLYACNNEGFLFCLDSTKGKILWRKKLDKGFFTSPVIEQGNLYTGGLSGKLYSIDLKKRKVNWTFTTRDRIIDSTPLIHKEVIIAGGNDKYLYAINKKTGKLKWKFYTGGKIFTSPVKIEDSVIITTIRGYVYSVSIEEGKKKWQYNTREKILMTPQVIDNKYIYIGTEQRIVILNKWGLVYTDYKKPMTTFAVINKKNIYLCSSDGVLSSLNIAGGDIKN